MKSLPMTALYTMTFNDYLNAPTDQIEGLLKRLEFCQKLIEGVLEAKKEMENLEGAMK